MDKKNLAKAALLAMVLTAGAIGADASTKATGVETSTLLAVAGCQPQQPQGGGYGGGYSQNEYYTSDDSQRPYAMPSRNPNSGSYSSGGYGAERQGGGFNNNYNNRSMSGGGSPSNYSSDQRFQSNGTNSNSPYNSAQNAGGGSYGTQRNSNPALNSSNDPYMETNR